MAWTCSRQNSLARQTMLKPRYCGSSASSRRRSSPSFCNPGRVRGRERSMARAARSASLRTRSRTVRSWGMALKPAELGRFSLVAAWGVSAAVATVDTSAEGDFAGQRAGGRDRPPPGKIRGRGGESPGGEARNRTEPVLFRAFCSKRRCRRGGYSPVSPGQRGRVESQRGRPGDGGRSMPIHDWTRVDAGIFHAFHLAWLGELQRVLNSGRLPSGYYALAEQVAGSLGPDVLTLQSPGQGNGATPDLTGTLTVTAAAPQVRLTVQPEGDEYTRRQSSLVIRHVSRHRIVAMIEVVAPGNKASQHAIRSLLARAEGAIDHGIHLLIADLHPPTDRDPQGVHGAIWQRLTGEKYQAPADKPLTLVAYSAGAVPTAYVEPVAVGDRLIDMPLFLTPEEYINVPLEPTYQAAYAGVPRFYRDILER